MLKGISLGNHLPAIESALSDLEKQGIVSRIWSNDHTVWKPDPTEISDRLGWLTVTDFMGQHLDGLKSFAEEVRGEGYQHVVLLGMGGSSLGPEVLRQAFGKSEGYPELIVLDSTVPAWVQSIADAIDPAKTIFVVSSKSGTTIEPNTFYKYFRGLVNKAVGEDKAGKNFVAVTDPGSSLERLASEHGFRKAFPNPPDIGGRYSVQSYFGLVPAALSGVDVPELLSRFDTMRESCGSVIPIEENPGALLGVIMGTMASRGRDKLTLITSPAKSSFGLWVEQLIAESTGKEGKGIVPIAGEPVVAPANYGDDRVFVYLRVEGDDNTVTDMQISRLEASDQPVVKLGLADKYDIGAEFFRWQFATAVAGAVIGIQPFDQPNVQQAKDITNDVLADFQASGNAPSTESVGTLPELLSQAKAGDYLAIMAYVRETPEMNRAIFRLRTQVMGKYKIATTLGYGPRFLHSTGQLHKGGPDSGLFLQITASHQQDIPVPGEPYSFGVLADAQAKGDFGALQTQGRRAARINIGSEGADAVAKMIQELD